MTAVQLKTEIQKVLEKVPEEVLGDVLAYIKELQKHSEDDLELARFMKQTLTEDRELLHKLAQ